MLEMLQHELQLRCLIPADSSCVALAAHAWLYRMFADTELPLQTDVVPVGNDQVSLQRNAFRPYCEVKGSDSAANPTTLALTAYSAKVCAIIVSAGLAYIILAFESTDQSLSLQMTSKSSTHTVATSPPLTPSLPPSPKTHIIMAPWHSLFSFSLLNMQCKVAYIGSSMPAGCIALSAFA